MYNWNNPNRRDRRGRKREQFLPFLNEKEAAKRQAEIAADVQLTEEKRRMMEMREVDTAVQEITPIIEAYMRTKEGKEELRLVVAEMRRIKVSRGLSSERGGF